MRICNVLKASKSGYYKHLNKNPSATEQKKEVIAFHARVFYRESNCIYGYRKIHEDFINELPEVSCSKDTLRKAMQDNELFSCTKEKHRYISGD